GRRRAVEARELQRQAHAPPRSDEPRDGSRERRALQERIRRRDRQDPESQVRSEDVSRVSPEDLPRERPQARDLGAPAENPRDCEARERERDLSDAGEDQERSFHALRYSVAPARLLAEMLKIGAR